MLHGAGGNNGGVAGIGGAGGGLAVQVMYVVLLTTMVLERLVA
jgi:hypothetical protein